MHISTGNLFQRMAALNLVIGIWMTNFEAYIEGAVIESTLKPSHVPKINSLGLALRIITLLLSDPIGSGSYSSSGCSSPTHVLMPVLLNPRGHLCMSTPVNMRMGAVFDENQQSPRMPPPSQTTTCVSSAHVSCQRLTQWPALSSLPFQHRGDRFSQVWTRVKKLGDRAREKMSVWERLNSLGSACYFTLCVETRNA